MRNLDSILSEIAAADLPPFGPTGFAGAVYFPGCVFPFGADENPGLATARAVVLAYLRETAPYGSSVDFYVLGLSVAARRNAVRSLVRDGSVGRRKDNDGVVCYVLPGTPGDRLPNLY